MNNKKIRVSDYLQAHGSFHNKLQSVIEDEVADKIDCIAFGFDPEHNFHSLHEKII